MSEIKENSLEKTPRSINFNPQESDLILQLVDEDTDIINCKKTGQYTKKEKTKVWDKITDDFNEGSRTKRTSKELSTKYKNLKQTFKKDISRKIKSQKQTGGGSYEGEGPSTYTCHSFGLTETDIVGVKNIYDSNNSFEQLPELPDPYSVFIWKLLMKT